MEKCCSTNCSSSSFTHRGSQPLSDVAVDPLRYKWFVRGMDCGSCAARVEKALAAMQGVSQVRVVYSTERLLVDMDSSVKASAIEAKVTELGFRLEDSLGTAEEPPFWKLHPDLSLLGGLTVLAALVSVLVSGWGELAFYAPAIVGLIPFIHKSLAQARNGSWFGIETLMSVAAIGALILGETFEATLVLLLFSIGQMLESVAARKARAGVQSLMQLTPDTAIRIENGQRIHDVPAELLQPGDLIEVRPGDRLPVDCILDDNVGDNASATGVFDESALTGESIPVSRLRGEKVMAGNLVVDKVVRVTVVSEPGSNAIDRIVQLIEEAEERRAPIARMVDRFSAWYTPLVIGISALVMFIPPLLFAASWSVWAYKALSLLLIACPCALVVSIPAAVTSGLAAAARFGALIKGGAALEQLRQVKHLAFDKTGTLTEGKPEVTAVEPFFSSGSGSDRDVLSLAAAIEQGSSHPLATAIINRAERLGITVPEAADVVVMPGAGVKGVVSGRSVQITAPKVLPQSLQTPNLMERISTLESQGNTVVVVLADQQVQGLIALADTLRSDAAEAVQRLKAMGISSTMLTGDNRRTAAAIAGQLGIDYRAELLPEDKVNAIRELQANGNGAVAMVGDGINDAPALKSAELGIAMGRGSDVALETADAALTHERLPELAGMISLSRRTAGIVRQNIVLSLGINMLFLLTTLLGITGLMGAVLSDVGGTILVTLNAMRLLSSR
ncbi:heavy metal translocating P-type ATPase [Endozoicomonas euniceicola]|uniref:P-type Zn(2+) transporter n=1 Tax=Endozoicomonas euniceicola TaxID=1234143 RepID=A0ABY6GWH1_9GAMM|nr:heavy metal translocating P-type ATPase [Endozoicomonas euniceicola]UYM17114.1 heavy metal translocating P-type ATPase [Endozoicomonas euniceicola]